MLNGQRITVLGAGIGGLTAALALARRGARVRVLERAESLREAGAGLQISPNGMAVLSALGVGEVAARDAVRAGAVALIDGAGGGVVTRLDLSALRSAQPWLLVHRGDLVTALADACRSAGVALGFGTDVTAIAHRDDAVRLDFAGGGGETVPLLVAADGIRSRARALLEPGVAPVFTGQVAWRALVPLEASGPANDTGATVRVYLGAGRHLVAYPIRAGGYLNIVAVRERAVWAAEGWRHADDPASLRAAFQGFGPDVERWLSSVQDVHLWGLHKHRVAARWHEGRLVILGDAAHATLPFLAQGACMAIEDAWVLAQCLDHADDPASGFARYQARRRARCTRIVAAADFNARVYHLRAPFRQVGHAALRIGGRIAPGAALKRFDWLYSHDVTRD